MSTNREALIALGIDLKGVRTTGKVICPKCSHTRKKKTEPCLNVNIDDGSYKCWNPGCDFVGRVNISQELYHKPKQREYIKPTFNNNTDLPEPIVNYLSGRSISQQTIKDSRITAGPTYMPQVYHEKLKGFLDAGESKESAEQKAKQLAFVMTTQFNYFRNGELVNRKYRDGKKNFRMEKGAELIFYGYDDVVNSNWCVIVEGEFDKDSWREAGITQVISVPNGAAITPHPEQLDLEYLDNCMELFDNKHKIIIATDNDDAGRLLRDELARRLGFDRCYKVDFNDCKDSNEFLISHGPGKLKDLIADENLIEYPLDGIITADMLWEEINDIVKNGLPTGEKVGLKSLDALMTWLDEYFGVITGIPNHGKSPFTMLICCLLAVQHGWKFAFFTPEHRKMGKFLIKIMEFIMGKRISNSKVTSQEVLDVRAFVNAHFYIIKPKDRDYTLDNILNLARGVVAKKGVRGIVLDPWNKLEHNRPKELSETEYVSRELDKITNFVEVNKVLALLVAHPVKMKKTGGLHEVPNLYDISSSSNFYNKPDFGMTVYRNMSTKRTEIYIQKCKDDEIGKIGMCELEWNPINGRLCEVGRPDNTNWLVQKPLQTELPFELETISGSAPPPLDDDDIPF